MAVCVLLASHIRTSDTCEIVIALSIVFVSPNSVILLPSHTGLSPALEPTRGELQRSLRLGQLANEPPRQVFLNA